MSKQITVLGASGAVGRLVVAEAAARGYSVVAAIHRTPLGHAHPQVQELPVNLDDRALLAAALHGSDAAISTLSSWKDPRHDVLERGMRALIPALAEAGIRRIVSLTGSDAYDGVSQPPPLTKLVHAGLGMLAGAVLHDGEAHIQLLRESTLDWTVIRSPIMTGSAETGYGLQPGFILPWSTISRAAVAACLLDQLESAEWIAQAPVISPRIAERASQPAPAELMARQMSPESGGTPLTDS